MNPFVTFTDAHGGRIYSVETSAGVVHVVADAVYAHLSDAMRVVKGRVNPVVAAMIEEEISVTDPVELKE